MPELSNEGDVVIKKWTLAKIKAKFGLWPTDYITVCSSCLQASCWQGKFYCDDYRTAGTVAKTVRDLLKRNLESPDYWPETRVLQTRIDDGPDCVRKP